LPGRDDPVTPARSSFGSEASVRAQAMTIKSGRNDRTNNVTYTFSASVLIAATRALARMMPALRSTHVVGDVPHEGEMGDVGHPAAGATSTTTTPASGHNSQHCQQRDLHTPYFAHKAIASLTQPERPARSVHPA
jgi:hypothetical protein